MSAACLMLAAWGMVAIAFCFVAVPLGTAAPSANAAAQADSESFESLLRAGVTAQSSGDLNSAINRYKAAIKANPRSIEAWLRLGDAEFIVEDTSAAFHAYTGAQGLDFKNPEASFRLGEIALAQGDTARAINQLETSLGNRPNNPATSNAAAVAYTILHKYQKAGVYYKRALAAEPNNPYWGNNYGLFQVASGDFDGALFTFSALALSPKADDQYRIKVALVYLALGRMKDALATAPHLKAPELRQALSANFYIDIPQGELELTVVDTTTEVRFVNTTRKTGSNPDASQADRGEAAEDSAVKANTTSASEEALRFGNPGNSNGSYKIQVGSDRSEEEALKDWQRLHERHADILGDLSLTIARADLGPKGIYFRIQIGPIEDSQEAARYCARLRERKVACLVVHP